MEVFPHCATILSTSKGPEFGTRSIESLSSHAMSCWYFRSMTLPFVSPFWKRSGCKGCAKPTSCNQILVKKQPAQVAVCIKATRCDADCIRQPFQDQVCATRKHPVLICACWTNDLTVIYFILFLKYSKITFDQIETLWTTERMKVHKSIVRIGVRRRAAGMASDGWIQEGHCCC